MKTYVIKEGATALGFEVENVYLSRGRIARLLRATDGVEDVHVAGRVGSSNDVRVEFKLQGHDYIVMEPFGDNSRYWIGPKRGKDDTAAAEKIETIRAVFERYKPPLPVKIYGDLVSLNFGALFRRQ